MEKKMTEPEIPKRTPSEELKTLRKRIAELEALKLDQNNATKLLQPEDEGIYKVVFESSNDSILLIDKKGKILDFNEQLIKISGYQKEELIGKNISSLAGKITKKSLAIITSNFIKRIAGLHVSPYEVELLKKNGELLSVKISAQPLKKDGKIIGDLVLLHNVTDRKKAEDELRFKGELLDSCSDSLLWYDDDDTPLYVNEAAYRAHGYTHDEMMRIKFRDLIVPEYSQQIPLKIEQLKKKGDTIFESAHYRKDGSILPLKIHAHVFKWDGKEFAFSICRDITERKQAEEALKISEQNFRNSIHTSPMGIRITDIDDQTLYLNQAFLKIFGYKNIDEVRIKPPLEHYTPESFAGFLQRKEKRLRGELCPEEVEIDIIREDGAIRHIQIFPKILIWNGKQQFQTIYNDVTERKQLEQDLKESEEKYRLIVENSRDIIFTLNPARIFVYVSPSIKRVLGYSQTDIIGQTFGSIIHPNDIETVIEAILRNIKDGYNTPGGIEFRARHISGEWRNFNGTGTAVHDADGKYMNFLGVARDISEHKQVEEALKESESKYRNVVELAKDGICIVQNKMIKYCNPQLAELWGGTVEEIKDTPFSKYLHPEALSMVVERYNRRIAGEQVPSKYETALIRKDGRKVNVEINIGVLEYLGQDAEIAIIHDITERKQVAEALKASEENFHNSLDNSLVGIRISDIDNNTLYANQALLDIFGYKNLDEVRVKSPQECYSPECYAEYLDMRRKYGLGELIPDQVDIDIIRKDGTVRHLQAMFKLVFWNGKQQYQTLYNDITERKQAAEALKASEQNFRNSLDSSSMGINIVDTNFNILYANQALLDIFGYENIDELKASPPSEHYTPESHANWVLRHEKLLRGEPVPSKIETDILRKDGTIRHLEIFRKEVFWNGKQRYQILYNDITERKRIEEALRESEEKYRLIVENSQDIIFTLREGIFIYVSPSVKQMLGYNQADLIGKSFMSLVHPDDRHIIEDAIRNGDEAANHTAGGHQYRFRHASGEWRWYSSKGTKMAGIGEKSINFIGIGNDITVNRETELQIREQKAFTDRVLENTTNAVIVVGPDRRVMLVNKAFENTFLLSKSKVEGKEIEEIVPDSRLAEAITQVLTSGKSQLQVEFRIKRVVVEKILIADIIYMQKNEVLTLLRDITDEREMQERLYLTDRLASVGQMAAGIAHELNNPLTGVVALSQLLLETGAPNEMKEDLETIKKEGQRAASIVKSLLSFARSHTTSIQAIDINTVICEVLNLRAYEDKANNIEITTHLAPDIPEIMTDRFQLQQVFLNIVLNAEQSMTSSNGHGNLTVTTEQVNGFIRISFADDGPGIPSEIMNRIFDPFFTTKEVGKGTGLGLSICYGIIANQGGKIYARSRQGKGATFVVELPLNGH